MKKKSIIFFDGYCVLCSRTIQFIIKYDSKKYFHFVPVQSEIGQSMIKRFPTSASQPLTQSVLLLENNQLYKQSTAVLKIIRRLKSPIKYLYFFILIPPFIRNLIYRQISKHRYVWFGQNNTCFVPDSKNDQLF